MPASPSGERLTAVISTVVAVAILGAAVAAQQARTPAGDRLARLESDLRFQLEMAFNTDPDEYRSRVDSLEQTLNAWRRAPRTADDYRVLVVWFRDAIVSSMPGRVSPTPTTPEFSAHPLRVAPAPVRQPRPDASALPSAATPAPVAPAPQPFVVVRTPPVEQPERDRPPTRAETTPDPTIDHAPQPTPQPSSGALPPAPTASQASGAYQPQAELVAAPAVLVNVAELSARIRGYHHGLAEVEAAMVAGDNVDGPQLVRLVAQLEQLAGQYRFVRLYYGALTAAERRAVPAPRSIGDTVRLIERRAASVAGDDFLNDFDAPRGDEPTLAERLRALAKATDEEG